MKTKSISAITTLFVLSLLAAARAATPVMPSDPPPSMNWPAGEPRQRSDDGGRGDAATLTSSQANQVNAILARYDALSLTIEQAKAIHEAFRQAGLPGGRAVN